MNRILPVISKTSKFVGKEKPSAAVRPASCGIIISFHRGGPNMSRSTVSFLFAAVLLFGTHVAQAANDSGACPGVVAVLRHQNICSVEGSS
jgi:hypothetical protein